MKKAIKIIDSKIKIVSIIFASLSFSLLNGQEKNYEPERSSVQIVKQAANGAKLKASTGTMYQLDSVVSQRYDEDNSIYSNYDLERYTYDSVKNNTAIEYYDWDNNEWEGDYKYEYISFVKGNCSVYIKYYYSSGEWVPTYKYQLTYDANCNSIRTLLLKYDEDAEDFEISNMYKRYYNDSNLLTREEYYTYSSSEGSYEYTRVDSFYYDNLNNQTVYLTYYLDGGYDYLQEFTYDANNNLIEDIRYYSYNSTTEKYTSGYMHEYEYNSNNERTKKSYYSWDGSVTWTVNWYYEYTYADTLEVSIYSSWNSSESVWVKRSKESFSYNPDITSSEIILPTGESMDKMLKSSIMKRWSSDTEEWIDYDNYSYRKYTYYYSEQKDEEGESAIDEGNSSVYHCKVYPNPATTFINIDIEGSQTATFTIYDLQGKIVLENTLSKDSQVDISSLQDGIYFYTLISNEEIYTGSIVKK